MKTMLIIYLVIAIVDFIIVMRGLKWAYNRSDETETIPTGVVVAWVIMCLLWPITTVIALASMYNKNETSKD